MLAGEYYDASITFTSDSRELRDSIYDLALGHQIFDVCCRRHPSIGFTTCIPQKPKNFLALVATCCQIYSEMHLRPFQLNVFRFESIEPMHSWLQKFGEQKCTSIREMHLGTWMSRHMIARNRYRQPFRFITYGNCVD
jgi:hypothetical protein